MNHTIVSLTTRQRDLLQTLLGAERPLSAALLGTRLRLSARQVSYGLKAIEPWLSQRQMHLQSTPGQGIALICSPDAAQQLEQELANGRYQLVLTTDQRAQLIILTFLQATEPIVLQTLADRNGVSRTTTLKDIIAAETWLAATGLNLHRRPNRGLWLEGHEAARREALARLLWGDFAADRSLFQLTHQHLLVFRLNQDRNVLPILADSAAYIDRLDLAAGLSHVAEAEAAFGGRFTDVTVLYLALTLAIQADRLAAGQPLTAVAPVEPWLRQHPVWPIAKHILEQLPSAGDADSRAAEQAAIARQLLAGAKHERWPGDLDIDTAYAHLVDHLMVLISEGYQLPQLEHDVTLHSGLITQVLPACLRQRFGLWAPSPRDAVKLSREKYAFEYHLARTLFGEITELIELKLPDREVANLALLLRAAYVRERPHRTGELVVVCPSGMATAQLLVARLRARFPRWKTMTVLSVRELSPARLANVDLIISTVPLSNLTVPIIEVHPLLLPEDVAAITTWLA